MVELWVGAGDCCERLRQSFGALFPFEELPAFFTVLAFFGGLGPSADVLPPVFGKEASLLSDLVGSLVPEIGSVDSLGVELTCFFARVLLCP